MELWLRCVPVLRCSGLSNLYSAGAETLFPPETLRQLIDDPAANPVVQALSRTEPTIALPSLSALLESFHEFTSRNRAGLFPQLQQATRSITDNIRASTIHFYNACDGVIYVSNVNASDMWHTRLQLLSVIEEKNVFSGVQQESKSILFEKCRLTVDELNSRGSFTVMICL